MINIFVEICNYTIVKVRSQILVLWKRFWSYSGSDSQQNRFVLHFDQCTYILSSNVWTNSRKVRPESISWPTYFSTVISITVLRCGMVFLLFEHSGAVENCGREYYAQTTVLEHSAPLFHCFHIYLYSTASSTVDCAHFPKCPSVTLQPVNSWIY